MKTKNITRKWAENTARDFLTKRNPDKWRGKGEKPPNFDTMCCTYDFGSPYVVLDVYFEYDEIENEWCHVCEIVDKKPDGKHVGMCERLSGYGVNSHLNISDTILDICNTFDWFCNE